MRLLERRPSAAIGPQNKARARASHHLASQLLSPPRPHQKKYGELRSTSRGAPAADRARRAVVLDAGTDRQFSVAVLFHEPDERLHCREGTLQGAGVPAGDLLLPAGIGPEAPPVSHTHTIFCAARRMRLSGSFLCTQQLLRDAPASLSRRAGPSSASRRPSSSTTASSRANRTRTMTNSRCRATAARPAAPLPRGAARTALYPACLRARASRYISVSATARVAFPFPLSVGRDDLPLPRLQG